MPVHLKEDTQLLAAVSKVIDEEGHGFHIPRICGSSRSFVNGHATLMGAKEQTDLAAKTSELNVSVNGNTIVVTGPLKPDDVSRIE